MVPAVHALGIRGSATMNRIGSAISILVASPAT